MTRTPDSVEKRGDPACRQRPRERIVKTARDLFHRHGIRAIGVDTIAEAAGTNKMTLYRNFGSKDDLIVECLTSIVAEVEDMWRDFETEHPGDPLAQIHAWVACVAECITSDDRGCELANAAVELTEIGHPARKLIENFKRDQRDRLAGLCRAAGIEQADLFADALALLVEGARVSRQSVGPDGPSARFVQIVEALIASVATAREFAPA